jgi:hypothetical protein
MSGSEDEYSGSDRGDDIDKRVGNQSTDKVYSVDVAKKRLDEARSRYLRFFDTKGEARRDGPLIKGVVTYTGNNRDRAGQKAEEADKKEGYSDHTIYRIRSLLQRAIIKRFRAWKALQAQRGVNNRPFKRWEHPNEGTKDGKVRTHVPQQSKYEEAARHFLANANMQMPVLSHHKQPGGNLSFDATLHLPRQVGLTGEQHVEKADMKALTGTGLKKNEVDTATLDQLKNHLKAAGAVYLPEESHKILKARVMKHIVLREKRHAEFAARAMAAAEDGGEEGDEEEEEEEEEAAPPPPPKKQKKADKEKQQFDMLVEKRNVLVDEAHTLFDKLTRTERFYIVASLNDYIEDEYNKNTLFDDPIFDLAKKLDIGGYNPSEVDAFNNTDTIRYQGGESNLLKDDIDDNQSNYVDDMDFGFRTLIENFGATTLKVFINGMKWQLEQNEAEKKAKEDAKKAAKKKATEAAAKRDAALDAARVAAADKAIAEAKKARAEQLADNAKKDREFERAERQKRKEEEEKAKRQRQIAKDALAKARQEQAARDAEHMAFLVQFKQNAAQHKEMARKRAADKKTPEMARQALLKITKDSLQNVHPSQKRRFLLELENRIRRSFTDPYAQGKDDFDTFMEEKDNTIGTVKYYEDNPDAFFKTARNLQFFNDTKGNIDDGGPFKGDRNKVANFFEHAEFTSPAPAGAEMEGQGKPGARFYVAKLLAETARYNQIKKKEPRYKPIPFDEVDPVPAQSRTYLSKSFIDKVKDFKRRQGLYRVLGDPRFPANMGTEFELDALDKDTDKKRKREETNASGARWFTRMQGSGLTNYGLMSARNSSDEDSSSSSDASSKRGCFEVR